MCLFKDLTFNNLKILFSVFGKDCLKLLKKVQIIFHFKTLHFSTSKLPTFHFKTFHFPLQNFPLQNSLLNDIEIVFDGADKNGIVNGIDNLVCVVVNVMFLDIV